MWIRVYECKRSIEKRWRGWIEGTEEHHGKRRWLKKEAGVAPIFAQDVRGGVYGGFETNTDLFSWSMEKYIYFSPPSPTVDEKLSGKEIKLY